jgi:hypothetical protein
MVGTGLSRLTGSASKKPYRVEICLTCEFSRLRHAVKQLKGDKMMIMETHSPLTQNLEPSEIQRVQQLMTTPYHLLPISDKHMRAMLGAQRSKEALSSNPWYGKKAQKAAREGKEWEYWRGLWMSGVNTMHPPKASSTAEVQHTGNPE